MVRLSQIGERVTIRRVRVNRLSNGYQIVNPFYLHLIGGSFKYKEGFVSGIVKLFENNYIPLNQPLVLSVNGDPQHKDLNRILLYLGIKLEFNSSLVKRVSLAGRSGVKVEVIPGLF